MTTLVGSSAFDKEFCDKLKTFLQNPQHKSLEDAAQLLLDAFSIAIAVGPFSHKCWVVAADPDECKSRIDAIYQIVWAFMARSEMVNIVVDSDVAKLFSGSEYPCRWQQAIRGVEDPESRQGQQRVSSPFVM